MSHPYQSASPTDRSRHDCYRTTPPPIQTHRSEGTQAYYSSDRPSQDHLHHAHSTSDLPLQPRSSITRSGHVGTRTNRASSASAGSGGGESSSTSRKIKAAQDELKRAQYELDKAIRESQLEAEVRLTAPPFSNEFRYINSCPPISDGICSKTFGSGRGGENDATCFS